MEFSYRCTHIDVVVGLQGTHLDKGNTVDFWQRRPSTAAVGMLVSPVQPCGIRAVSSMLFDLEDGAQDDVERFDSGLHQQAVYAIQRLVQDASASVSEVSDVLLGLTQQDDLVAAAQALGYSVKLRDCVGGGQGAQCLQNLRHSFLILSPSAHSHSSRGRYAEEVIIDPTFRDNFVIAHPSARYSAVLEALPLVFIGTLSKVQPLVAALCSEMSLAFKAAGIVMPPWRSLRSMMTKWMPRRSLDLPLPTCPPTASHAASAVSTGTAAASLSCAATSTAAGQPLVMPAHARAAPMREDSTRWLRQACSAAEAQRGHSLAPSSTNSATINSASSSNCSSVSNGLPHAALLHASTDCESDPGSPAVPQALTSKTAAALSAGAVPQDVQQVVANHACGTRAAAGGHQGAAACAASARHSTVCAEPLQRVVGGFGAFSFTKSSPL